MHSVPVTFMGKIKKGKMRREKSKWRFKDRNNPPPSTDTHTHTLETSAKENPNIIMNYTWMLNKY